MRLTIFLLINNQVLKMQRRTVLQLGAASFALAHTFSAANACEPTASAQRITGETVLGNALLKVSKMGLGCMGMSEFYGDINPKAVNRTLSAAADYGITLFDTADMYGDGRNEALIGEFAKSRRSSLIISSKFGIVRSKDVWSISNDPRYIRAACEASLKRLKTDYIDIYYVHRINPSQSIEETMATMADLVKEGKIRGVGLSEVSSNTIRHAHALCPLTAVETEFSLFSREPELEILPTCTQLGIGFIPYAPLSRGLLTSERQDASHLKASDFRSQLPRFQPANFAINSQTVARLSEFAKQRGYSTAQVALGWIMAKHPQVIPIPGARSVRHLADNIGALAVELSSEEVAEVSNLFPINGAAGRRYSDQELTTVNI